MGETCATCRFIGPMSQKRRDLFACRRYPPTAHVIVESREFKKDHYKGITVWSERHSDISIWPTTGLADWCGEYQPAQEGEGR